MYHLLIFYFLLLVTDIHTSIFASFSYYCSVTQPTTLYMEEEVPENSASNSIPARLKLRRSSVHDHFDAVQVQHPLTKKTVSGSACKHCKSTFTSRVSTNLKNHLKAKHQEAHDQVLRKYLVDIFKVIVCKLFSLGEDNEKSEVIVQKEAANTSSLVDNRASKSAKRRREREAKEDQENWDQLLANWVAGSTVPMCVVADKNFQEFIKSLNPAVSIKLLCVEVHCFTFNLFSTTFLEGKRSVVLLRRPLICSWSK